MVTRKEDTSKRVARRKYEEKNKELRKEKPHQENNNMEE